MNQSVTKATPTGIAHAAPRLPEAQVEATLLSPPQVQGNQVAAGPEQPAISHGEPLRLPADAPIVLADILARAARHTADHGITYIQADGATNTQSYGDLLDEAERILAGLRRLDLQPQDKVIFQLARNDDFIPALWACLLGGFVPIPLAVASTYQVGHSAASKLHNAWELLDQPRVLTSATLAPAIREWAQQARLAALTVSVIEELRQSEPDPTWHASQADDLALLLLTSGSTGMPKAVMQSHRALLCQIAGTIQMYHYTSDEVTLNWLPLDHVGGLIFFHLRDLYLCCRQIHAPTTLVLEQPLLWLDWIDRYRATITWAPNFAYALINAREDAIVRRHWDLASLRVCLNGAEVIVAAVARRFLTLLAPHGLPATAMHPAWGMAETCSGVIFSQYFRLQTTTDDDPFVAVGTPLPGLSIRIVDDQNQVAAAGSIGRLQIKGLSVTSGYYQNPALNQEVFTADGWFNTGDLGVIRNGSLTLTGREKDVIIINGVNYYSHEIEKVVEEIAGVEVSYTAAVAVRDGDSNTDKLAIVFHPTANDERGLADLLGAIRSRVVRQVGINPSYLLPVAKEAIPKTSLGKIQRSQLVKQFAAGEFAVLVAQIALAHQQRRGVVIAPRNAVEAEMAGIWQELLAVAQVSMDDNFFELGGKSLLVTQLISRIRSSFQVELPLPTLFDTPTIAGLADHIQASRAAQAMQMSADPLDGEREEGLL
jgi:acyl-CoA synthetase (AMP-forming)/AMP-acid ligase II/acyl carrier protein